MSDPYTELAELAGGFIHEIKNHLSTFGLNLQLLAEDFNDPQTQRERRAFERVQRLQNECERLVEVSNDFLRFSRIEQLNLQPCDLLVVLEELIDFFGPMARNSNIKVNRYLPSDLPPVFLDSEIFKQALLNLLLNAEQAMPKGGEVTIQAIISPENLTLNLIDTGKGISAEGLEKIFKPFYSTRPGGTGLGLPTTKKIIEAHGGTIEALSEPGKGTKFSIRLPLKIS
jgi:signal transduction histidine kinase